MHILGNLRIKHYEVHHLYDESDFETGCRQNGIFDGENLDC